jgi:hypothetical protein
MKTVGVRESDDGADLYLETDCWTPWQYYVPEEELEPYYRDTNALMMKLERMPPAVRARLDRIEIRCPAKGCLLATVYWVLRRPTAKELEWDRHERPLRAAHGVPTELQSHQRGYFLYVGRTAGGTEVYDILNYLHGGLCPNSCILYWQAGCRHGTASIDHAFIHHSFSLAGRWHHFRETEEDVVARLPEYARRLWGKRVFPPEPSAWRPKKRQPRPVSSSEVKKGAPELRKGV